MFGLKVTDVEGNKIGFGKANGRYWSKIITALILGYIMVAFTKKKQGLHDIIAGNASNKKGMTITCTRAAIPLHSIVAGELGRYTKSLVRISPLRSL